MLFIQENLAHRVNSCIARVHHETLYHEFRSNFVDFYTHIQKCAGEYFYTYMKLF